MHKALLLLKKIPKGKVTTYGILAKICKTSPRAIGRIMANNPDPVNCPCYKVIGSSGELVGYSGKGGLETKRKLLERDGIKFVNRKVDKMYFYEFRNSDVTRVTNKMSHMRHVERSTKTPIAA